MKWRRTVHYHPDKTSKRVNFTMSKVLFTNLTLPFLNLLQPKTRFAATKRSSTIPTFLEKLKRCMNIILVVLTTLLMIEHSTYSGAEIDRLGVTSLPCE